ncbi:MAG: DUF5693 family protein [Bacillota bacterium]
MHGHAVIRRIAWGLILIALLASAPVLANRYVRETGSRAVDLVLDMPALRVLAQQDGRSMEDLLVEAAKAGVTSIAVSEMNTKDVAEHGLALVRTGAELRAEVVMAASPNPFLVRLLASPDFSEAYTYLLPVDKETAGRLWREVQLRHEPGRIALIEPAAGEPGAGAIVMHYREKQLLSYGVGWDPRDFEMVRKAGLRPLPRPRPAPGATPESITAIFADLDRLAPETRSIMFQGGEILGWRPNTTAALEQTAAEIKKRGWVLNLVEHFSQLSFVDQAGYQYLAHALDYQIARVFSMGQEWQDKVQPYEAVDMWWRAVLERNSRSIYLRPFLAKQDPGLDATQTTMKYFARAVSELHARDYATGVPDTFEPYYVPWYLKVLMGLGAVGATILWFSYTWPFTARMLYALMGIGIAGQAGMLFVMPNTGTELLAIALATIFPTLAAAWLMLRWGLGSAELKPEVQIPAKPQLGWIFREVGISSLTFFGMNLIGGILIAGVMGDIRHILEFEYFRGVKLVFLAPLLLAVLTYLLLGRKGTPLAVVRSLARDGLNLLQVTVKYRELLLLGILALAGLYYIQRSGNFPTVPIAQFELEMRAALERWLLARPRTKEFFIAYPALVVSVAFLSTAVRKYVPLFIVAAVTGGVSIINSFEHIRTPWALSLLRSVNGLWLGLVVGAGALIGLVILRAVIIRLFPDEDALR